MLRKKKNSWEKVTTTKIRMSKTKKNIKKFVDHHYIESVLLVHHYYNIRTLKSVFLVHQYYKNQNVKKNEKNIQSLSFVWFSNFDYLWCKYLRRFAINK